MSTIAADAVADWCRLDLEILRRLYERWTTGTDALTWSMLVAQLVQPQAPAKAIADLQRAACREAMRVQVLDALAVSISKVQVELALSDPGDADQLVQLLQDSGVGGRMHSLVAPGGLLTRDTLLGTLAVDGATAIVYRDDEVIGTAFLVAPDLVLTAAHVVLQNNGDQFIAQLTPGLSFSFRVHIGSTGKEPVVAYPAPTAALVHSSLPWGAPPDKLFVPPRPGSPDQLDFALVRLDREVRHVGALNVRSPPGLARDDALVVLGYPGGTAMRWHVGSVLEVGPERLKHQANALPGMSGSCCIDVHGSPAALHEGSLLTRKFAIGGEKGPLGQNRAVRLCAIRAAMGVGSEDPLLARSRSPALDFHDEAMVRHWANAGLRLAPAVLQDK